MGHKSIFFKGGPDVPIVRSACSAGAAVCVAPTAALEHADASASATPACHNPPPPPPAITHPRNIKSFRCSYKFVSVPLRHHISTDLSGNFMTEQNPHMEVIDEYPGTTTPFIRSKSNSNFKSHFHTSYPRVHLHLLWPCFDPDIAQDVHDPPENAMTQKTP
jgi:hypothetical protein